MVCFLSNQLTCQELICLFFLIREGTRRWLEEQVTAGDKAASESSRQTEGPDLASPTSTQTAETTDKATLITGLTDQYWQYLTTAS